jgi:hypothetical protein
VIQRSPRDLTDAELQDPNQWELDQAKEIETTGRKPRAVVSVAFDGSDFATVSNAARLAGMKVSQFIREAALERATLPTQFVTFGATLVETKGLWWSDTDSTRNISGASILEPA